jgi:hypothetical protein
MAKANVRIAQPLTNGTLIEQGADFDKPLNAGFRIRWTYPGGKPTVTAIAGGSFAWVDLVQRFMLYPDIKAYPNFSDSSNPPYFAIW